MLKNLFVHLAISVAATPLGWIYVNYLYRGGRRRKPGQHRYTEHCVTMMWATIRPTADKATWRQVAIGGKLPLEQGTL